jgi:hypothetical protein
MILIAKFILMLAWLVACVQVPVWVYQWVLHWVIALKWAFNSGR